MILKGCGTVDPFEDATKLQGGAHTSMHPDGRQGCSKSIRIVQIGLCGREGADQTSVYSKSASSSNLASESGAFPRKKAHRY